MRIFVLVADDDPMMCDLLRFILREANFQVATVNDGRQVVAPVKKHRPAVLILNVLLPGINGVDVCRSLRADPATAELPIVVYSALTDIATVEAMRRAGANSYLFKPTPRPALIETLHQVLGRPPLG